MTGVDDLATWLRAQWDEDERSTRALLVEAQHAQLSLQDPKLLGRVIPGWHSWPAVEQVCIARLAEVDAKRALLEEAIRPYLGGDTTTARVAWLSLRLLALPMAGRNGYQESWRP